MKRFRFPLQPVAVLRADRERRAQQAFATAIQRASAAEDELGAVRRHLATYADAMCASRRERCRAVAAGYSVAGYARVCTAEETAEKALAAALEEVQRCRREYLDARRRLEVVRRLEQKARQQHRAAELREEQAGFDEASNGRYARAAAAPLGPVVKPTS